MSDGFEKYVCLVLALTGWPSVDRDDITPPEVEDETKALRKLQKQIREERQKLTEAAIKLGEDRTQLMVSELAWLDNVKSEGVAGYSSVFAL